MAFTERCRSNLPHEKYGLVSRYRAPTLVVRQGMIRALLPALRSGRM